MDSDYVDAVNGQQHVPPGQRMCRLAKSLDIDLQTARARFCPQSPDFLPFQVASSKIEWSLRQVLNDLDKADEAHHSVCLAPESWILLTELLLCMPRYLITSILREYKFTAVLCKSLIYLCRQVAPLNCQDKRLSGLWKRIKGSNTNGTGVNIDDDERLRIVKETSEAFSAFTNTLKVLIHLAQGDRSGEPDHLKYHIQQALKIAPEQLGNFLHLAFTFVSGDLVRKSDLVNEVHHEAWPATIALPFSVSSNFMAYIDYWNLVVSLSPGSSGWPIHSAFTHYAFRTTLYALTLMESSASNPTKCGVQQELEALIIIHTLSPLREIVGARKSSAAIGLEQTESSTFAHQFEIELIRLRDMLPTEPCLRTYASLFSLSIGNRYAMFFKTDRDRDWTVEIFDYLEESTYANDNQKSEAISQESRGIFLGSVFESLALNRHQFPDSLVVQILDNSSGLPDQSTGPPEQESGHAPQWSLISNILMEHSHVYTTPNNSGSEMTEVLLASISTADDLSAGEPEQRSALLQLLTRLVHGFEVKRDLTIFLAYWAHQLGSVWETKCGLDVIWVDESLLHTLVKGVSQLSIDQFLAELRKSFNMLEVESSSKGTPVKIYVALAQLDIILRGIETDQGIDKSRPIVAEICQYITTTQFLLEIWEGSQEWRYLRILTTIATVWPEAMSDDNWEVFLHRSGYICTCNVTDSVIYDLEGDNHDYRRWYHAFTFGIQASQHVSRFKWWPGVLRDEVQRIYSRYRNVLGGLWSIAMEQSTKSDMEVFNLYRKKPVQQLTSTSSFMLACTSYLLQNLEFLELCTDEYDNIFSYIFGLATETVYSTQEDGGAESLNFPNLFKQMILLVRNNSTENTYDLLSHSVFSTIASNSCAMKETKRESRHVIAKQIFSLECVLMLDLQKLGAGDKAKLGDAVSQISRLGLDSVELVRLIVMVHDELVQIPGQDSILPSSPGKKMHQKKQKYLHGSDDMCLDDYELTHLACQLDRFQFNCESLPQILLTFSSLCKRAFGNLIHRACKDETANFLEALSAQLSFFAKVPAANVSGIRSRPAMAWLAASLYTISWQTPSIYQQAKDISDVDRQSVKVAMSTYILEILCPAKSTELDRPTDSILSSGRLLVCISMLELLLSSPILVNILSDDEAQRVMQVSMDMLDNINKEIRVSETNGQPELRQRHTLNMTIRLYRFQQVRKQSGLGANKLIKDLDLIRIVSDQCDSSNISQSSREQFRQRGLNTAMNYVTQDLDRSTMDERLPLYTKLLQMVTWTLEDLCVVRACFSRSQVMEDDLEEKAALSELFLRAIRRLRDADQTLTAQLLCTNVISTFMQKQARMVRVEHIDELLLAVCTCAQLNTCGDGARATIAPRSASLYSALCHLVVVALRGHRRRFQGRYHLVMPVLAVLMQGLYIPHTLPASHGKMDDGLQLQLQDNVVVEKFGRAQANVYARILTILCEPSESVLKRKRSSMSGMRSSLNDERKRERQIVGHHLLYIVEIYCQCQLKGRLCESDMRPALNTGLWAMLGTIDAEALRRVNAAMGSASRAVFKDLYQDYRRLSKGSASR